LAGFVVAAVAALAACGSGGPHSGAPVLTAPGAHAANGKGTTLTLVITIPKRAVAQGHRGPEYISASTAGALITISNINADTTAQSYYALTPGTQPCPTTNGTTTCTLTATLPGDGFGSESVSIALYDEPLTSTTPPTTASVLSSGTLTTTIVEGSANATIPIVCTGIVAGFKAGTTGTLVSGGATSTGSFVVEATDADGNVILASDGALTPTNSVVSLTLTPSLGVGGITLRDQTQNPSGMFTTSLSNVKVGDTIQVATSSSTGNVVGVPILATMAGQPPVQLRIPASYASMVPNPIVTIFPSSMTEIAGVPAWGTLGGTSGGVLVLNATSVTGMEISSSYYATTAFSCVPGGGVTIDFIAQGIGANFVAAEETGGGSDLQLARFLQVNGTCTSSVVNFDGSSNGITPPVGAWEDVADDGADVSGLIQQTGAGGYGSNYIVLGAETAGGAGLYSQGDASNQYAFRSLQAAALETGASGLAFRGQPGAIQSYGLGSGPRAEAADGAGTLYVLNTAGTLQTCTVGATLTCNAGVSLSGYVPSTSQHAMTIGPDGNLWIATTGGLLQVNTSTGAQTLYGTTTYDSVTSSGDGRIYALSTTLNHVDAFP
jgi:hypothetical protein